MVGADETVKEVDKPNDLTETSEPATTNESVTTAHKTSPPKKSADQELIERLKASTSGRDITEEFFNAAKELDRGELAIHSSYSLSDAVSAIELMDVKMDSGMQPPDMNLGLENALKNGKLKQKLSVTELLATVDCSIAALTSWLRDAQSLDQTVFTNIWLHDLSKISDPVHLALSTAIVYLVHLFRTVVNMAACYSEEDFTSAFAFEKQSISFTDVEKKLQTAADLVSGRIKAKQNKQENSALLNRIRFYQQTLVAFDSLIPLNERAFESRKRQPQLGAGKIALKLVISHLQNARDTVKLGKQPPKGSDDNYSWLNCFQPRVNQHLLPPTFPREIRFTSRNSGYDYLITVFQSILSMVEEVPEANNILSLDTLMDYLERYSYADVLTRSFCQMILLPLDDCLLGVRPMIDLVMNSIDEFSPSIQQEQLQQCINKISTELSTLYDEFMMDAVRAFLSVIQLFGHNRTRFHDKFLPELIDMFSMLRTQAISLETNLRDVLSKTDVHQSQSFSTFSDFYATRLAVLYMDISFQLNLFVDYELPYVFWAYSDVLYRRICGYCKNRSQIVVYNLNFQRQNTADYVKAQARERCVRSNLHRMIVYENLSTGYYFLFSALADDKKIKVPPHEENRFWRRLYPCTQIFAEEEMSYTRYWNYFLYARERDDPPTKMPDFEVTTRYTTAMEYFRRAETTMTRNYVVNEPLTRAIKSNLIALTMLTKRLDAGKKIRIEYLQGPLYPTVSIK